MLDRVLARFHRCHTVQVADMVTEVNDISTCKGHAVFELPPDSQDFANVTMQMERRGNQTTRSPYDDARYTVVACLLVCDGVALHDGVVRPYEYLAVMQQQCICELGQLLTCFVIVDDDRFVADVAAGHDQGEKLWPTLQIEKESVMQRSIGQHEPQEGISWGNCGGDR